MLRAPITLLSCRFPKRAILSQAHPLLAAHTPVRGFSNASGGPGRPDAVARSVAGIEARKQEAELRKAVAEARKAEFEAEAAMAKAAAEAEAAVQRTKAEAEAATQRTKAEAAKAEAEVYVVKAKAAAEADAAAQRTKAEAAKAEAEAARARKAAAEAEAAGMDTAARKSSSETFLGRHLSAATATVAAAVIGFAGLLVNFFLSRQSDSATEAGQAEAMRKFERRRITAIKERICSRLPAAAPEAAATLGSYRFPRPEALKALEGMSTQAGIYMVVGPKGEGKTTLVSQFVSSHPHVLYVSLQGGSIDSAVRAVAAALGYDMADSNEEASARKHGYKLPDLLSPQSTDMYDALLKAFECACLELRSERKLVPGFSPVLVLDHANRPLRRSSVVPPSSAPPALDAPAPTPAAVAALPDNNLMCATVEKGHYLANESIASLVMVSSDLLQELDAWRRAAGRDSVRFIRVAPFSDADAANLLSRRIFASLDVGKTRQPTPEDLAAIQREYASTISTITLTLGTRARWLVQSLQHMARPRTDTELAASGVPIPAQYHPFLPFELRNSSLRVDPDVWEALQSLIEARKGDANALLNVDSTFALPPLALSESLANRFAERILVVDSALRALLAAPVSYADMELRFFASSVHVLRLLSELHVIFYDHNTKYVDLESPLIRRVVTARLASKDHELSLQLVRQLLAWQAVTRVMAKLQQQKAAEGVESSTWFKASRALKLESDLDAASQKVSELEVQIDSTRAALRHHRAC